jgi:hypothetical protein
MGELIEPNATGDTRMTWDAYNEDEVDQARTTFENLKAKGYFAYKVKKKGGKGKVVDEFDPEAEKIIMALPMRGG